MWLIRSISFDPFDPDVLWVITSSEILKLHKPKPKKVDESRVRLFYKLIKNEPTEAQVLDAVYRNMGLHRGERMRKRAMSNLSMLAPKVVVIAGLLSGKGKGIFNIVPYITGNTQLTIEDMYTTWTDFTFPYFAVFLQWDLRDVLYDVQQVPFGRVFGTSHGLMLGFTWQIARYYEERRRLMYKLIVDPPKDLEGRIAASLRYRELTEHLNLLSGGLFEKQVKEIEQGGLSWLAY